MIEVKLKKFDKCGSQMSLVAELQSQNDLQTQSQTTLNWNSFPKWRKFTQERRAEEKLTSQKSGFLLQEERWNKSKKFSYFSQINRSVASSHLPGNITSKKKLRFRVTLIDLISLEGHREKNWGFPDSSVGKEPACTAQTPVRFLGREHLLKKG